MIAIPQHPKQIFTMCLIEDFCCFSGIGQLNFPQCCHTCTCENSIFCAETALSARTRKDKFPFHLRQPVYSCAEIEGRIRRELVQRHDRLVRCVFRSSLSRRLAGLRQLLGYIHAVNFQDQTHQLSFRRARRRPVCLVGPQQDERHLLELEQA